MMRLLLFCFIFCTSLPVSLAQKKADLTVPEDSLLAIASRIKKSVNDSERVVLNKRFHVLLTQALETRGSYDYSFDRLTTIAKIKSPDDRFRIFNWNLPAAKGLNRFFCLMQFREKDRMNVLSLIDVSDTLKDPEFRRLSSGAWYGALYYKIIRNESGGKIFYTLLGWNGVSSGLFQKIIEVMTFDTSGNPVFGAEIFKDYRTGKNKRVIFSYSSSATMILRYDQQLLPDPGKNQKSTLRGNLKGKPEWIILFDRLGTLTELNEENQKAYPVPTGENMDGFVFGDKGWNYIQNIPVRNP